LEPSLARLIGRLRQQTRYGPIRLQWLLWERYQLHVSRWAIYQAVKRQGLITRGRRRRKKDYRLYTLPIPGQEIQIDTKHLMPRKDPLQTRYYQYTAIDDCTRLRVLRIYDEITVNHSLEFLHQVVSQMPFKIRAVRTDGGIEFTYPFPAKKEHPFTQACRKLGLEHRINRPGYPQANGKVERSHRTDDEEFYRVTPQTRWSTDLPGWEHRYNHHRGHQSLHGLSPMEFLLALQSTGRSVTYVRG
jgi:transposase InsO family protein